jgi:hypothetical protein
MANAPKKDPEFKRFAAKRIIIGVILAVGVLWTLGSIMGILQRPEPIPQATLEGGAHEEAAQGDVGEQGHVPGAAKTVSEKSAGTPADASYAQQSTHAVATKNDAPETHGEASATQGEGHATKATASHAAGSNSAESHAATSHTADTGEESPHTKAAPAAQEHAAQTGADHGSTAEGASEGGEQGGHASAVGETMAAPKLPERKERGVATVEAMIAPMEYELKERFYGWRPNDLIDFTDNVNNYQLGVLEVTRRAVVALNERISRTGSTDAFSPSLEDATNWFMIKATKYWFPSAETKYQEGINDLNRYRDALQAKRATFYTRADNLIPLLASFEDLLGSCDENLVKRVEDDGSEVSWFKADNYFFYAKGVAAAMAPILEAIHHDFLITMETRHGTELLHHALESCQTAADLDPWLITDSGLDSILANHRANMAAPISHARFYLGALIKALST